MIQGVQALRQNWRTCLGSYLLVGSHTPSPSFCQALGALNLHRFCSIDVFLWGNASQFVSYSFRLRYQPRQCGG
jgi:hypothetical protein